MSDEPKFVTVAETLARHERMIGTLYKTYAEQMPGDEEFWRGLSDEEEEHAAWLDSMCDLVETGLALSGWTRFPLREVEASIHRLKRRISETKGSVPDPKEALAEALKVENAMLEKQFFMFVESDHPDVVVVLQKLASTTRDHIARIEHALAERLSDEAT